MKKRILIAVDVVVIIALAAFGSFYFFKYQDLKKNPPAANQEQVAQKYITAVSKLYASLPKDEKPGVTQITDDKAVETLKKQYGSFFDKAITGDVTLIYPNAKLALLYRPSSNQLINVSAVNIQNNAVVKVFGPGRQAAEDKLKAAQITATDGGDAKTTLTGVTVVDLSGKNADQAKKVADTVGGQVGDLPAGEDKPADTDIAVYAP